MAGMGCYPTYIEGNLIELEVRRRLLAETRASRGLAGTVGQPRTQYGVSGTAVVFRQVHDCVMRLCAGGSRKFGFSTKGKPASLPWLAGVVVPWSVSSAWWESKYVVVKRRSVNKKELV